jgi:hypothetical protein
LLCLAKCKHALQISRFGEILFDELIVVHHGFEGRAFSPLDFAIRPGRG